MTCNTFDSPTSKYSSNVLTTDELASSLYSFSDLISIEKNPALKYNSSNLLLASLLTTNLINTIKTNNNLSYLINDYSNLVNRLSQGNITNTEFASFLDYSGYDLDNVISIVQNTITNINLNSNTGTSVNYISTESSDYLNQLDYYYDKNFSVSMTGGFCSIYTGILTQLATLVAAGATIISELTNASSFVISQLNSIKNIINNLIDSLVSKMKNIIKNVTDKITNIPNMIQSMRKHFIKKIKDASNFFSDANVKNIKGLVESIITQASKCFENISPDILSYLLYRFCQLTDIVHAFMQSPMQGITELLSAYTTQKSVLENMSNAAKYRELTQGIPVADQNYIDQTRSDVASRINSMNTGTIAPNVHITLKDLSPEELAIAASIHSSSPDDIANLNYIGSEYLTFSSKVIHEKYESFPGEGYKKMDSVLIGLLARVAKRTGNKLLILSAFRNPKYNAELPGAASNSCHLTGLAADVAVSSISNTKNYIKALSEEGFGGIATYNEGFIHGDLGARRCWRMDFDSDVIKLHMSDSFRTGRPLIETPVSPVNRYDTTTTTLPESPYQVAQDALRALGISQ
jgi:uncharacterized protein YcbK (DUF882 family)